MLDKVSPQAGDQTRPVNNLLRTLRDADYALIAPHLHGAQAFANDVLYSPGENVETVHFPCGPSMVSYLVPTREYTSPL